MLTRVLLLLVLFAAPAHAEALLQAKTTYAVVAGVLAWDDPGLKPFPKAGRKDQELFDRLGQLGVPEHQRTLLLDDDATAKAFAEAVKKAVAQAPAGSTLVLYYAGHGVKDKAGAIVFASADLRLDKVDKTGLHLDRLAKMVAGFKGERIILLADCCFSGGLAAVAQAIAKTGVSTLALTSAEASNVSTSNWTFTQTLLDALAGRALLDRDDDGAITLGELSVEVREAMRYREGQRSGFSAFDVAESVVVAPAGHEPDQLAPGSGDFERRDWVRITHRGRKRVARIIGQRDERLFVELYDYAKASQVWVPRTAAKPIVFETWPVGAKLRVKWGGKVYDAKVLRIDNDFMWITYPGWDASWNEWISAERVVR